MASPQAATDVRGSVAERFWSKVDQPENGCWLWQGAAVGYGRFHYAGETRNAHRIAWMLAHDSDEPELNVLHDCDVKLCVRPSHLHLGDSMMNMREAIERDRMNRAVGERHPSAKLTKGKVRLMRSFRARGVTQRALATYFGIDTTSVLRILQGRNWRSA